MRVIYVRKSILKWVILGLVLILLGAVVFSLYTARQRELPGVDSGGRRYHSDVEAASRNVTNYIIDVDFDPDMKKLSCRQKVSYINNETIPLKELYFHLYPNAFKYEDRTPFSSDEWLQAYPEGFSSGSLDIEELRVAGKDTPFSIGGKSEDILHIPLAAEIKPGKRLEIEMKYTVKLPNCQGRFGYGEYTYNITNWYPILSVYDHTGWNNDPYYGIGDPFYSDVANYKVTVHAPSAYIIASTGVVIDKAEEGGRMKWVIDAPAVRDFAWIASDRFQVSSVQVGDVTVYSYYFTPRAGEKAMHYGADAIKIFSEAFGEYPYQQFSVVQADFFIGGMEYPNLVMIDKGLYSGTALGLLEYVTVHEAAHQWWYGIVGNDEIDEAWLDEALTEYSTILYYGRRYDAEQQEKVYQDMVVNKGYGYLSAAEEPGTREEIDKPTHQFSDLWVYDAVVYGKGAIMFHELHKAMGDEDFREALQIYFENLKFQNATKEDLLACLKEATGKEWDAFLEEWLSGQS